MIRDACKRHMGADARRSAKITTTSYSSAEIKRCVLCAFFRIGLISLLPLCGFMAPAVADSKEIQIHANPNMMYSPQAVAVEVGDRITWINDSGVMHEIYFSKNPTGSGEKRLRYVLTSGRNISIVVTEPGDYDYVCRWHGMWGSIRVVQQSPR